VPSPFIFERWVDPPSDDWNFVVAAVVVCYLHSTLALVICTRVSRAGNVDGEVLG